MERGGFRSVAGDEEGARRGAHATDWGKQCFAAASRADGNSRRGTSRVCAEPLLCTTRLGPRSAFILSGTKNRLSRIFPSHCECGGAASSDGGRACPRRKRNSWAGCVRFRPSGRDAAADRHFGCRAHEAGSGERRAGAFKRCRGGNSGAGRIVSHREYGAVRSHFSSFITLQTRVECPVFESITVVRGRQLQVTVLAFSCLTTTQCSMSSALEGGNWLRTGGGVVATGGLFAAHPARSKQDTSQKFLMSSVFARMRLLVDGDLGYRSDEKIPCEAGADINLIKALQPFDRET